MFAKGRIWLAYLIVFVSSTCTMVIELVAGRIMAPYIGVSLYTWTSIIGIVLAGISLGNYLGGLIADRRATREVLGLVFLGGGLASLSILVTTHLVFTSAIDLPLIPKIVCFTSAIFFLPSLILGMASPIVIKLALADLAHSGGTVGSIYAVSTTGSIFGTFLTGFYLISWLGTRSIVWIVGISLVVMAVVVGGYFRPKGRLAALVGTLILCGAALWLNSSKTLVWLPGAFMASPSQPTGFFAGPILPQLTGYLAVGVSVLVVLGAVALGQRAAVPALVLTVVAASAVYLGWTMDLYRAPCEVESNYYCIRVSEQTTAAGLQRALILDHLVHSYTTLDDPKALGYGYEQVYAEVTTYYVATSGMGENGRLDTLFIGGGGYTFPRYVEASYPRSTIDVMEIDPAVTEMAHQKLNLPADTRIVSHNEDARSFLLGWQDPKKFDVIYGDAFNDMSVPYHLTTVEFDRMLAGRLKPGGMYMVNVIDKYEGGDFMRAFANALHVVFPHVYMLSQARTFGSSHANTYILLATQEPFDYDAFQKANGADGLIKRVTTEMLPDKDMEEYMKGGRAITLTDDFVPVDQLVAPLFVERGL